MTSTEHPPPFPPHTHTPYQELQLATITTQQCDLSGLSEQFTAEEFKGSVDNTGTNKSSGPGSLLMRFL
jgi:hypothetical protein